MESVISSALEALKSERLEYQAFDTDDQELLEFIHKNDVNDPVIGALSLTEPPKPRTKKYTAECIDGLAKCDFIVTINLPPSVATKATNSNDDSKATRSTEKSEIIGYIGLGSPGDTARHQCATIMISIASPYQSRGYGSEAINWIVDWGFTYQNLHRIAIETVSFNERAVALYQKLGFKIEGRKRDAILYGGKRYDTIDMSMLVHEWEELRGAFNVEY